MNRKTGPTTAGPERPGKAGGAGRPVRRRRRAWAVLGLVALLAVILVLAARVLAGRPGFQRWALERGIELSGLPVTLEDMEGLLTAGTVSFGSLNWKGEGVEVTFEGVTLSWKPSVFALLARTVVVEELRADRVEARFTGTGRTATPPESIDLPAWFHLRRVRIGQLSLEWPGERHVFRDLAFSARAGRPGILVEVEGVLTPWGELSGRARAGLAEPFPLRGRFEAGAPEGSFPWRGRLEFRGDRREITAAGSLLAKGQEFSFSARVEPGAAIPLREISARAEQAVFSDWHPKAPPVPLDLGITVRPIPGNEFEGSLEIANRHPGPLDAGVLPFTRLSGDFSGSPRRGETSRLEVFLPAGGFLAGRVRWVEDTFEWEADCRDMSAAHLDSRLPGYFLSGNASGSFARSGPSARGAFRERAGGHEIDLAWEDGKIEVGRLLLRLAGGTVTARGRLTPEGSFPFEVSGDFDSLEAAAAGLDRFPARDAGGSFRAAGELVPDPRAFIELEIEECLVREIPFRGRASADVDLAGATGLEGGISSTTGHVSFSGRSGFDPFSLDLEWRGEIETAGEIHPDLGGRLAGAGTLSGTPDDPAVSFELEGTGLSWLGRYSADHLSARGKLARDGRGSPRFPELRVVARNAHDRLEAAGSWDPGKIDISWRARTGRPGRYLPELAGSLEASGSLSGTMAAPVIDFKASGKDLVYGRGHPPVELTEVRGTLFRDRRGRPGIRGASLAAAFPGGRLEASGSAGAETIDARWKLSVSSPGELRAGLSGSLEASGRLSGSPGSPRLAASVSGREAGYGEAWRAAEFSLRADARDWGRGESRFELSLERGVLGGLETGSLSLVLEGSSARHRLSGQASGDDFEARFSLGGSYSEVDRCWTGRILEISDRGIYRLALSEPVDARAGPDSFEAGPFSLETSLGRIESEGFLASPGRWRTSGRVSGLPIATLTRLTGRRLPGRLSSDLVFDGRWDLRAEPHLRGEALFTRRSGDLRVEGEGGEPWQIEEAEIAAFFRDDSLDGRLSAAGPRARVTASVEASLERVGLGWRIEPRAPLRADLSARLPSLSSLPYPGREIFQAGGSLEIDLGIRGTLETPVIEGKAEGRDLSLAWEEEGFLLAGGRLSAVLDGETLELGHFSARGRSGTLAGRGFFRFGPEGRGELTLSLDGFEAVSRPDREAVITGRAQLASGPGTLSLEGNLGLERGRLVIPDRARFSPGPDIEIVGRRLPEEKTAAEKLVEAFPGLEVNLSLDAGPDFQVAIDGLRTSLSGVLALSAGPAGRPMARGTLNLVRGTYYAYGQELEIVEGRVIFRGPIDNPQLELLALRRGLEVEAGVRLTGSAQFPVITLFSEPDVPDLDKLSWLVLGRGAENAAQTDISLMVAAVNALLPTGQAAGMQSLIANAFGLTEIGVMPEDDLGETVIRLGRRLSRSVYLAWERGTSGTVNLLRLNYYLGRRWSIRATTGSEHGAGIFHRVDFD